MRYVMTQKFWSLATDFSIRDEHGDDQFLVRGEPFSLGAKLHLLNLQGEELAYISQRLLAWGATYEIHRPGRDVTVVKKELFTLFHCKFEVDGPGDEDFEARGDFTDHEYEILGPNGTAAVVSKQWFSWMDTYGIEIHSGDTSLLLATAVVIDLVCHAAE